MDYVLGDVASLITGNVTPNRPKLTKRALTPTKHQPSPNVTPKSQLVDDKSIFMSPSVQKKKAMVKKSPKRIFQNPDLNETNENEGPNSPKADKVKKHLKDELNVDISLNSSKDSSNSPKKRRTKYVESTPDEIVKNPGKTHEVNITRNKKNNSAPDINNDVDQKENLPEPTVKSPNKRKKKQTKNTDGAQSNTQNSSSPKTSSAVNDEKTKDEAATEDSKKDDKQNPKKKNKKRKKKPKQTQQLQENNKSESTKDQPEQEGSVNPNAITNQDTDSEHESDNEIESENEENNKAVLDTGPAESSDEEEDLPNKKEVTEDNKEALVSEDELKRTLFVGNVPFSKKCKKEIKKIFNKYGTIESVRIRTVPVKDARVTPKLAVIKNELHPDRTTVNVYVKFKDEDSVEKALVENNTVLNSNHLRVSRSDSTGASHDPRCSVFVGNIPFGLEDEGLRVKFQNCGDIESVRIIRDKKTNAGKGFGYVNFTSKDGVELALALTEEDLTIKNRILRVKRCTRLTNKQMSRQDTGRKGNQVNQQDNRSFNKPHGNFEGNFSRNDGSNKGNFGRNDGNKSNFGRNQGNFGRGGGNTGRYQGGRGRSQGVASRNQGNFGRNHGNFNQNQGSDQNNDAQAEGAYRRIMNKRKNEDGNTDGPPTKQPREKKPRKEFVGVTAEKKKKHKFNKGQKKKKAISEILTK